MPRTLVGSRIRERREARGLKQADLARRAGISASYLNLIEHNRRGIAGKVLLDIAEVLDLEIAQLLEGADSALVQELQTAAAQADNPVELDRVEELVSRFPGWAGLVAKMQRRGDQYEHTVEALSDRLTHDPFLSESLHEMLSSVTAIRATSGILTQVDTMEQLQQRRFQTNIYQESSRLSDLSQAMVSYFDQLAEGGQTLTTPLDEVEAFLERHHFHFADLEASGPEMVMSLIEQSTGLASHSARHIAADVLLLYQDDAGRMPLEPFLEAALETGFDTAVLAARFQVTADAVFRRLAFLPPGGSLPDFGLIVCDGTGAVLLRKPIPGFSLPRYGSACVLWPVYQAMTRPHAPVTAVLETVEDRVFRAEAMATYQPVPGAAGAQVVRSTMLFHAARREDAVIEGKPLLSVGLSCRICAREGCAVRREPSIHSAPL